MKLTDYLHVTITMTPLANFAILLKSQPNQILAKSHKKFEMFFM